jgi:hypothetical protein
VLHCTALPCAALHSSSTTVSYILFFYRALVKSATSAEARYWGSLGSSLSIRLANSHANSLAGSLASSLARIITSSRATVV